MDTLAPGTPAVIHEFYGDGRRERFDRCVVTGNGERIEVARLRAHADFHPDDCATDAGQRVPVLHEVVGALIRLRYLLG